MSFSFTATAVDPHANNHHSSMNSIHHQQYMSPLTGSSSSSTGGSPTTAAQVQVAVAAQAAANMPLLTSIANVKDSRWLTLEVCREYQRGKCTRSEQECKFAHPPAHVEVNSGKVIACFDSLKVCTSYSNYFQCIKINFQFHFSRILSTGYYSFERERKNSLKESVFLRGHLYTHAVNLMIKIRILK